MEQDNNKLTSNDNNEIITNDLSKEISTRCTWHKNITEINLSASNIDYLNGNVQFPDHLVELNLSHNKLVQVPSIVLNQKTLETLDLSHNAIEYFDKRPDFCHTLKCLDLSVNQLKGPPYWIWAEKPKNLVSVNISCNPEITKSILNGYFEVLLQHVTLISEIDLHNCGFTSKQEELLATFKNAKIIHFGIDKYCYHGANSLGEIPSTGLKQCGGVEQLNLSNTHIHTINSSISTLKNLRQLNLSCNKISNIPKEFCSLVNLETCRLTSNNLLYLPDEMHRLTNLARLYLDSNQLCMLPEKLMDLPNLKVLDLYDNHLNEFQEDYSSLEELDLAQNNLAEPNDVEYLEKKERLRLMYGNRYDGSKPEVEEQESVYSSEESDEEYYRTIYNGDGCDNGPEPPEKDGSERSSSPEDWDSDSHWVPHDINFSTPPKPWVNFIHQKLREGHFCPGDVHVVSISEQVMYEKKLVPKVEVEFIGQFDDYSSDDS